MTMSLDLTDLTKFVSIPLPRLLEEVERSAAAASSGSASFSPVVGVISAAEGFNWKCIVTGITLTEDLRKLLLLLLLLFLTVNSHYLML